MQNHTDLLNLIAEKIGAKTYLEIGVFNPDHNFNKINVEHKVGVDPDPAAGATFKVESDYFFESIINKEPRYDLVFLDGLHHAYQLKKDLINAWSVLKLGGVIVIHDSNPPTEATTRVPRGSQREWCGDVFRTICQIDNAKMTVNFDYGCCVIRKTNSDQELAFTDIDIDWPTFDKNRTDLLKLVPVSYATEAISSWTAFR